MASQKKNISKVPFILLALLTSATFAGQGNDKTLVSIPASQSPAPAYTAKSPHPEHVKLAGNHMLKLHQDLKRFPTRAEFVKHLEKEMKITEAQAEKILVEMDID
ncbi:MAG: hypothetical protein ACOH2E_05580 [Candidatus Paracaedibacter sp.]